MLIVRLMSVITVYKYNVKTVFFNVDNIYAYNNVLLN